MTGAVNTLKQHQVKRPETIPIAKSMQIQPPIVMDTSNFNFIKEQANFAPFRGI